MAIQYYRRSVDAGHGTQIVEVEDGVITNQWLEARQGRYTGSGNPELVGQSVKAMYGYGFRKVGKAENDRRIEDDYNEIEAEREAIMDDLGF